MMRAVLSLSVLLVLGTIPALAQEPAVDLDAPGRRAAEKERDASSMPVEVIRWIGLERGATVADLSAGSGYHSWIFSQWVGPEGVVYAQSAYRPDTLKARVAEGDLAAAGNVRYVETVPEIPDGVLDLAFTDRNYHDIPPERVPEVLATIKNKLKPGALFVVIDARAREGRDTEAHRIADDVILSEVQAAGFELVETSEMLANPDDDRDGPDWDERESLDRSLIKFRKPAGAHAGHGGR